MKLLVVRVVCGTPHCSWIHEITQWKEEDDMTSFQPQFPEDEKHCGSCGANASFIDNEGVPLCKNDAIIAMTRDPHELATAVADLLERHQGVV
jgi:hypothetical protein